MSNKMDEWYEEDEQVFVHPKDPYHRVDVLESSRHVRVKMGGEVVAETQRPMILFETGLPPRYYMPPDYSVEAGGERVEDLVWYYPEPIPEVGKIEGLPCFFNEKVDLEEQVRPRTQGS